MMSSCWVERHSGRIEDIISVPEPILNADGLEVVMRDSGAVTQKLGSSWALSSPCFRMSCSQSVVRVDDIDAMRVAAKIQRE